MRTPQRARLERLEKQTTAPAEPPLVVVVTGEPTPAQAEQIAQAQAAGRAVQLVEIGVVPCRTDPGGGESEKPAGAN